MKELIIIQNGLNGWHKFMSSTKKYLDEHLDNNHIVEISNVNDLWNSWSGLDKMGKNLEKFVYTCCEKHKPIKISFIGHSLGGLIIRNCIGKLEKNNFFDKIKPNLYVSIATPHLGVYSISNIKWYLAKYAIGQTGKELLMEDSENIFMEMSKPNTPYIDGLNKFNKKILYGNIEGDNTVSFESSCITHSVILDDYNFGELLEIKVGSNLQNIKTVHENFPTKLYYNLNKIEWIRKGIDISDQFNIHNAIKTNNEILKDIVRSF